MIINLTQHPATPEQLAGGVVDLPDTSELRDALTFTAIPTPDEIRDRAASVAHIALAYAADSDLADTTGELRAMIGGAPYLMAPLERALLDNGITPVYAYSDRVSDERVVDGEVVKTNRFVHRGFIAAS